MKASLEFEGIQKPDGSPKDNAEYVRLIYLVGSEVVEMLHTTSPFNKARALKQLPIIYQKRRTASLRICDVCNSRLDVKRVHGTEMRLCHMHRIIHEARKAGEKRT